VCNCVSIILFWFSESIAIKKVPYKYDYHKPCNQSCITSLITLHYLRPNCYFKVYGLLSASFFGALIYQFSYSEAWVSLLTFFVIWLPTKRNVSVFVHFIVLWLYNLHIISSKNGILIICVEQKGACGIWPNALDHVQEIKFSNISLP